jgi:hypothetical protein
MQIAGGHARAPVSGAATAKKTKTKNVCAQLSSVRPRSLCAPPLLSPLLAPVPYGGSPVLPLRMPALAPKGAFPWDAGTRAGGQEGGQNEKEQTLFHACIRLADKKMISTLASNSSNLCNSVFQGGHTVGEAGPSSPIPTCHKNVS